MGSSRRILVVAAEPDQRASTVRLRRMLDELADRPGVVVDVWFLRTGDIEPWWPRSRVVDDLRTDRLGRLFGLAGAIGPRVSGLRLRRWAGTVAPDTVVLDDGLGARVLPSFRSRPVVVERRNAELPFGRTLEPPPALTPDLVLEDPGQDGSFDSPDLVDLTAVDQARARAPQALRARLGVGPDAPIVVGWGAGGWLDGADLFVRALWHLEHRHGTVAHGVWFGLVDELETRQLRDEAVRCGVADRLHLLPDEDQSERLAADAVFLPYREPPARREVPPVVLAGVGVVAFADAAEDAPWTTRVAPLDLDAVAAALDRAIATDVPPWLSEARERHGLAGWVDRFLDATDRSTRRS